MFRIIICLFVGFLNVLSCIWHTYDVCLQAALGLMGATNSVLFILEFKLLMMIDNGFI